MIKLVGAIMILLSSGSLGVFIHKALQSRCTGLRHMLSAIDILQAEIVFKRVPMVQAVNSAAKGTGGSVSNFWERVGAALKRGLTFKDSFEESKPSLGSGAFTKDDMEIFHSLTAILGRYDSFEQAQMLKNVRSLVERQWVDSREELEQKGRLYRALGISLGIVLVLMVV